MTEEGLEKHVRELMDERDKRYQERFDSQKQAITKAEIAMNERVSLLNELRGNVATKDQLESVIEKVHDLSSRLDRIDGRSTGLKEGWGLIVSIAVICSAAVAVLSHFFFK